MACAGGHVHTCRPSTCEIDRDSASDWLVFDMGHVLDLQVGAVSCVRSVYHITAWIKLVVRITRIEG